MNKLKNTWLKTMGPFGDAPLRMEQMRDERDKCKRVAADAYRVEAVPPEEARLRRVEDELLRLRAGIGGSYYWSGWRWWTLFAVITFGTSVLARLLSAGLFGV